MRLDDLFDVGELEALIAAGFVARRQHPTKALELYNYTERCQWERGAWNDITRACRGLIVDSLGRVVARPFRKFFNYGQPEAGPLDLSEPATVTDKMDGSLGIWYPDGSLRGAIATRGAFDSDQAILATDIWREDYQWEPPAGWTPLFEIVYPENRIVLDYGATKDLFLLGAVEIATGRSVGPHDERLFGWPGPRAATLTLATLAEALAEPPRPNAEGLVVHLHRSDERVKIKQGDYVQLHRIVTGLNERVVWEHVSQGKPLADLLDPLPDEFHAWTRDVAVGLLTRIDHDSQAIEAAYAEIVGELPEGFSRKDFAGEAVRHPLRHGLFARLDGKDYRPMLWKAAYPEGNRSVRPGAAPDRGTP